MARIKGQKQGTKFEWSKLWKLETDGTYDFHQTSCALKNECHASLPHSITWAPQVNLPYLQWYLACHSILLQLRHCQSTVARYRQRLCPSWLLDSENWAVAQDSKSSRFVLWPCYHFRCWLHPWPAPFRTSHASAPRFFFSCYQPWGCGHLYPWSLTKDTSYNVRNWRPGLRKLNLLLMFADSPNAAAISGSSSIMRSRFSATLSFRSLTC